TGTPLRKARRASITVRAAPDPDIHEEPMRNHRFAVAAAAAGVAALILPAVTFARSPAPWYWSADRAEAALMTGYKIADPQDIFDAIGVLHVLGRDKFSVDGVR